MLLKAAEDHHINLKESIMIGDKTILKRQLMQVKYYIDANMKNWDKKFLNLIKGFK